MKQSLANFPGWYITSKLSYHCIRDVVYDGDATSLLSLISLRNLSEWGADPVGKALVAQA